MKWNGGGGGAQDGVQGMLRTEHNASNELWKRGLALSLKIILGHSKGALSMWMAAFLQLLLLIQTNWLECRGNWKELIPVSRSSTSLKQRMESNSWYIKRKTDLKSFQFSFCSWMKKEKKRMAMFKRMHSSSREQTRHFSLEEVSRIARNPLIWARPQIWVFMMCCFHEIQ